MQCKHENTRQTQMGGVPQDAQPLTVKVKTNKELETITGQSRSECKVLTRTGPSSGKERRVRTRYAREMWSWVTREGPG